MGSLFSALASLVTFWTEFRNAQKDGTWSNLVFFLSLGGAILISLAVVLLIVVLPMETIQRHPVAFFGLMFGGIALGVTTLTLAVKKTNRKQLEKKSGTSRPTH